jgi:5-methylcytosine-specific restriction endonuclease McrA
LVEAVTTRQLTPQPDPRPRRVRRALRGRPRTRAVVVVDIAHLTDDDVTPAGRAARLLWRLHGAPPALTTAGVKRLCDDADLQLLLTHGHTILGITAPTPSIPTRLREAVYARDQGCRFAGCRAPVAWCDLHHVTAREDGGPTILTNLVALCRRHHTAITTGRWTLTMTDDGTVTLRRGRIVHTTDPPLHLTLAPD